VLPTAISSAAGSVSVTYTCTAPQTIAAFTNVTPVTIATAGNTSTPSFSASANANAPLPGVAAIPSPQTVMISGSSVAPTITSLSANFGAPGTVITITGTNLANASSVNFGTVPGANLFCAPAGTSCQVTVPGIVGGPVNITVVTPGGPSNAMPFTVGGGIVPPSPPGAITIPTTVGWNLVAGPTGATVNGGSGAMYSWQAGDTQYQTFGPGTTLQAAQGYWAYFTTPGSVSLPPSGPQTATVQLPASSWVMIGNPGTAPVTVTGADVVYTYNPTGGYAPTTTLQPGQGAWAISIFGGFATIR
jgi:hypothetical protein